MQRSGLDESSALYTRSGGKVHLSVTRMLEDTRASITLRTLRLGCRFDFRSILRGVPLSEKTVTDKRENKNRLSRGSADTRKHMAGTVQRGNAISPLRFIWTVHSRKYMWFPFLLSTCFWQSIRSSPIFVWQSCKSSSCLCQVFIAANCQINGLQVDFRINHYGERDWAAGSFIFKSMSPRST